MKLALLGATGRTGGHLLTQALAEGHEVHALVRNPSALPRTTGLQVTVGDALNLESVTEVISGTHAVISALGPRGAKSPSLLAVAAENLVAAMQAHGPRRLIAVSAAGAFIADDPNAGVVLKVVLPRAFGSVFTDVVAAERVIRHSGLDWTLVRATYLSNGKRSGRYRVSQDFKPKGGLRISRADVADFILAELAQGNWLKSSPALAY